MFFLGVAPFHCHELKPKEWKTRDLLLFLNPLATFEPSITSKGHVTSFGSIDKMSYEQKINLKKFVEQLEFLKIFGYLIPTVLLGIATFRYKLQEMKPVVQVLGGVFLIGQWYVNSEYVRELHKFTNKIDQSLSDEKK